MAKPPVISQSRLFHDLIDKLEPNLRQTFLDAVADWKSGVNYSELLRSLRNGDISGAIDALGLDQGALTPFAEAKRAAYVQGGDLAATTVNGPTGSKIAIRFDMANPSAEGWIRDNVGNRITQITEEQIANVRSVILAGYTKGQGPETIARDIAGRMEGTKRVGGIIGLSDVQVKYQQDMRSRLESGMPDEMRKVLSGMTLRDKRYDATIRKSIETGKPLTKKQIDTMVERYTAKMISHRAVTIARTETGMAVMSARYEEWKQALVKLGAPDSALIKTWRHVGVTKDYRWWHREWNGKSVTGLDTPFIMANGSQMQYALDPNGGAGECVNCRCDTTFRIDHSWRLRR
jgi:hypothetical protein